jgi:predicted aspartyl protease
MTANGLADICIANAKELTLGQFTLKNVEINYGKGMSDDVFLLGMNVIGLFKLEQQGDVMRLSKQ